jgi:hypothetical protein
LVVLAQISMSWVVTNLPEMAFLSESKKFKEKIFLFDRVSNQSKNIYLFFSIFIICFFIFCNLLEFNIAYRLPDFITIISLFFYGYLWHLMILQCYFVRVHKTDIFYKLHILLLFFAPFFCIVGYNWNSEFGIALALLSLSILFYFPHNFMYSKFRRGLLPQ